MGEWTPVGSELARPPAARRPPAGCAGRAWNPKGPQITHFCHQMGRHPTIWDFKTGIRHRIPARISPWGSRGLNPNFFLSILDPNMPKSIFSGRVSNLSTTHSNGFGVPGAQGGPRGPRGARPWAATGAQGPKGSLGAPKGPLGGPRGPLGSPRGPLGPLGPLLGVAREGSLP